MNEETIAAKIYLNRDINNTKAMLNMIALVSKADISKVISEYEAIESGAKVIAYITSGIELSEAQMKKIREKITKKFEDEKLIFLFELDAEVIGGFRVQIGDNMIDFTYESFLSEN